jgi:hypothetical protein
MLEHEGDSGILLTDGGQKAREPLMCSRAGDLAPWNFGFDLNAFGDAGSFASLPFGDYSISGSASLSNASGSPSLDVSSSDPPSLLAHRPLAQVRKSVMMLLLVLTWSLLHCFARIVTAAHAFIIC